MVRFEITVAELERRIEVEAPGWIHRAGLRTAKFASGTAHASFPNLWSDIKRVYISLQGSKCAFCEKWLEDEAIEHDVEHFRPKGSVDRWPVPPKLRKAGVIVQRGSSRNEPGYARLVYHPLNYVAACKTCNTILKKNWFPVSGTRNLNGDDPAKMPSERALLIYPISDIDSDPEELIGFNGLSPKAKHSTGFPCHRALVTIQIFQLDNWRRRKELNKDRAEWLEKLYWALSQRQNPSSTRDEVRKAVSAIARLTSKKFRHANCLRSFQRLYDANSDEAKSIYKKVHRWLLSVSN